MSIITAQELLTRVRALNVWRCGDVRAPHKPLLFLLAIARLLRGHDRLVRFAEIEDGLADLLRRYGPPRANVHPEYPFWWLQTDGLWEVQDGQALARRRGSNDPTRRALRADGVGGFPLEVHATFRRDRRIVRRAVSLVLHAHFPDSIHFPLMSELGLDAAGLSEPVGRDPAFRREVLSAYGHRCAVCGFNLRIGSGIDFALDAAHLKWRQAGGPDDVRNGLALCAIHHRALDAGVITLDERCRLLISGDAHGDGELARWFLSFGRRPVELPHSVSLVVEPAFAAWHRREVFRGVARD